jgi:hypothetical protein
VLPHLSFAQNVKENAGIVLDMEPIADTVFLAVNRDRLGTHHFHIVSGISFPGK